MQSAPEYLQRFVISRRAVCNLRDQAEDKLTRTI